MKDPKIYSIQDLMTKDFDDEEIDIVSKSLIYSLIVGMFRYIKKDLSDQEIIKLCKTDNWFEKYQWTHHQRNEFKKKLDKIYYNLYRFGPVKCSNSSNMFLMTYGLELKPTPYKKSYDKKKKAQ